MKYFKGQTNKQTIVMSLLNSTPTSKLYKMAELLEIIGGED